jgi:hypothetical protein
MILRESPEILVFQWQGRFGRVHAVKRYRFAAFGRGHAPADFPLGRLILVPFGTDPCCAPLERESRPEVNFRSCERYLGNSISLPGQLEELRYQFTVVATVTIR